MPVQARGVAVGKSAAHVLGGDVERIRANRPEALPRKTSSEAVADRTVN